jgi:molybdopterin-synthase adenylyltransferase
VSLEFPMLTDPELARYEWQMWVSGFGETGQRRLKAATVLISRIGGVGGTVAYYLAAAGIGRLMLAHAGNVKPSDLHRQILMSTPWIGKSRVECAQQRIHELNPHVEVMPINANLDVDQAMRYTFDADVCVGAAPRFEERFALNSAAVHYRKPLVDCSMFEMEGQITTIQPGRTACLACLFPEDPPMWKREFPVIGAVSGMVGALGAMEVIKLITGVGEPLFNRLLTIDLGSMSFRTITISRRPDCAVCSASTS